MIRENLKKLIESGVSPLHVAKETKIPTATCYRIFKGHASLDNVTLKNAERLNEYYKKVVVRGKKQHS